MVFSPFKYFSFRRLKTKQEFATASNKGQGSLEYILMLFLVTMIALGGLYQFNSAFRVWANNYFGNYLACLLEYGELPSLGGGGGPMGCDAEFEDFSLANGRPAKGFDAIGEEKKSKEDQAADDKNADQSTNVSASGVDPNSRFGSRSGSGGDGSGSGRVGPGTADEGDEDIGEDGFASSTARNRGGSREAPLESTSLPVREGDYYGDDEKQKKAIAKKNVDSGGASQLKKTSLDVRQPSSNKKGAGEEEEGAFDLGLGGYVRMLLIIAIVIALIILLGSQGLQISKEWD